MANEPQAQNYEFKAEMKRLLNLIIHSLYSHREVFLRELVSNASDALNKLRFTRLTNGDIINAEDELAIRIDVDEKESTFSIEDNGVGMTKDDLINYLGNVANSGALEFLEKIKEEGSAFDGNMIGQFGVGFYSVFMVADEIAVDSRFSTNGSTPNIWRSNGEGTFTIEDSTRENKGTKITFKLKDEAKEFASDFRIKEVLKKYSNFVDFPIYVNGERVNTVSPLWRKKKEDIKPEELQEFYKFVSGDFEEPLEWLRLDLEGIINFNALLFIPKHAPNMLFSREGKDRYPHLYTNKILIQENCESLLPEYLSFVRGVVDTEDLPLNVSREVVQNSPVMTKIKNVLVSKILNMLEEMDKNEHEKYCDFFTKFGSIFKTGLNQDYANRDKIIELYKFETTKTENDKFAGFKEYIERMNPEQKDIYYLAGDSKSSVSKSPLLEYYTKNEIEVILLSDPVDVFTFPYIRDYKEKNIISIDKASVTPDGKKDEKEPSAMTSSLISVVKEILGDAVEDVIDSSRLVESPVALSAGKQAMDSQMEKMMKIIDKNFTASKKVLELNFEHPLIKNLNKIAIADPNDEMLRTSISQLYDTALLVDGALSSPMEYAKRSFEILEKATK